MDGETYRLLVMGQCAAGFIILPILLTMSAPYGRHFRGGWGPVLHSRVAWLGMELPAVLVIALVYVFTGPQPADDVSWVFLLLWEVHYIYRTFIYPLLLRGSRKTFPALLALCAFGFNVNNGLINGYGLFSKSSAVTWAHFTDGWVIAGTVLFFGGLALNIYSDAIIRDLRRNKRFSGKGQYGIPQGGLFTLVSNPHYLGEIVEWIGWALLAQNVAGWAFAWFTFANLMPRAVLNHHWYKRTFTNYPKNRKALIPFIF